MFNFHARATLCLLGLILPKTSVVHGAQHISPVRQQNILVSQSLLELSPVTYTLYRMSGGKK